jgi:hypothetical protein
MKMRESKFGAPAGVYRAVFKGVSEFKGDGKPRVGKDGKPMGPAAEWQWEIAGGPYAGQLVGRITAAEPTTKNSCGVLLSGVVGRTLRRDEEADPNQYIGQQHQIVLGPSREDPDKAHVVQVHHLDNRPPVPPPSAAANGAVVPPAPVPPSVAPPVPPPRPARSAAPVGDEAAAKTARWAAQFWVDLATTPPGSPPQLLTGQQLQLHVNATKDQTDRDAIGVMSYDTSSGWKTPGDFGFTPDEAPF